MQLFSNVILHMKYNQVSHCHKKSSDKLNLTSVWQHQSTCRLAHCGTNIIHNYNFSAFVYVKKITSPSCGFHVERRWPVRVSSADMTPDECATVTRRPSPLVSTQRTSPAPPSDTCEQHCHHSSHYAHFKTAITICIMKEKGKTDHYLQ